jgi:SAM-dependent methyltransferase
MRGGGVRGGGVNLALTQGWAGAALPAAAGPTLAQVMARVPQRSAVPRWNFQWAFDHYEDTILTLAQAYGARRLCEIGGGRDPAFGAQAMANLKIDYTISDIDAGELALAPAGFRTACFDIAGDPAAPGFPAANSYDLMFSRMVFEHVGDVEKAWTNVHRLLRPGGVGLAFFPTLYAWPFVLNHLIPESASQKLLALFSREDRSADGGNPKFPAVYDWTYGSQRKLAPMLKRAGFSQIEVVPFWGHDYLRKIPVARNIDDAWTRACVALDLRLQTTYAFVLVRKDEAA